MSLVNYMQRKHEHTLQALNEDIRKWLDKTANLKPNATTSESPLKRYEVEEKYLQSSHKKAAFPVAKWEMREVSRDSFISYRGKLYLAREKCIKRQAFLNATYQPNFSNLHLP